jgi:restriction endonuclease S subunit
MLRLAFDNPLPADWEERPLAQLSIRRRGYSWSKGQEAPKSESGALPVVRIPNIGDELDTRDLLHLRGVSQRDAVDFSVDRGWILFVGSNGNPARIGDSVLIDCDHPILFASFLQGITVKDPNQLMPAYLACWMRLEWVHATFSHMSQQTTGLANFSWSAVKRLPVRFPKEIEEQRAIAATIDAATQALHETERKALAARRVTDASMQQLFSVDARRRVRLSEVADIEAGIALNSQRAPRTQVFQYLTVVNVQRGRIQVDEPRFMELKDSEVPRKLLAAGDILVVEGHANTGEIGRAAIVGPIEAGMSYQNHLFRVRTFDPEMDSDYLLRALNSTYSRRHWAAVANTSSGLNTINRRQLQRLLVPKPSPGEQHNVVSVCKRAEDVVAQLEREAEALAALRQSLVRGLLSGSHRIGRLGP